MICYHHNDLDGKTAAWYVHTYKPKGIEDNAGSYFMCTYNDKFDKHKPTDDVVIVDLSFTEATYNDFLNICKTARTVTYIDHHKSTIDLFNTHRDELQSIRNLTYFVSDCASGAALTYVYFNCMDMVAKMYKEKKENEQYDITAKANVEDGNTYIDFIVSHGKNNVPDITTVKLTDFGKYVDDFDCWKKNYEESDMFLLGCDCNDTAITKFESKIMSNKTRVFNTEFWDRIDIDVSKFISNGRIIHKYITSRYRRELKHSFVWNHDGVDFICINATGNSWNFDFKLEKYEAAILFYYDGSSNKWSYSCYSAESSKFNCEAFCKKYGGGGHLHAAGFSTDKLIFTSPEYLHKTSESLEKVIFLGGTCNGDDWREEFIDTWKNKVKDHESLKDVELFNPVVDNWDEEAQKKENEVKDKAFVNLFVITPKMHGSFSIAEAIECCHSSSAKVVFAVYDKYNEWIGQTDGNGNRIEKSFDAIGDLIKKHNGLYIKVDGKDACSKLIDEIIKGIE